MSKRSLDFLQHPARLADYKFGITRLGITSIKCSIASDAKNTAKFIFTKRGEQVK